MIKEKVLFMANKAPHYKIPLFNKFMEKLDIKFAFTHESKKVEGLKVDYENVPGAGYGKYKIHFGLTKIIKQEGPEQVVLLPTDPLHLIDNLLVYRYCKKKKIPFIIWAVRWDYPHFPLKDRVSDFFYRPLLKKANRVIVPGKKAYDYNLSQGVKESKIIVAPNADEISYDKEGGEKFKKELVSKYNLKGKKIVLYVGRLIKRKGVKYLIEAFSRIKDKNTVLLIAGGRDFYNLGEPSLQKELLEIVRKNNLEKRIIFLGEIKNNLLPAIHRLSDVLVVPSITEGIPEPWGLVVNEAMQFGLPVVATDAVGAAYDLIQDGKTGFMVREKDSEELKDAIEKILNDKRLRDKMGEGAMRIIKEKYNYRNMAQGLFDAVQEISKEQESRLKKRDY